MPQPIDMGPQPVPSAIMTEQAMKVDYEHKCYDGGLDEGKEPVLRQRTIFFPIHELVWIPMHPACVVCSSTLRIVKKEVVEVR